MTDRLILHLRSRNHVTRARVAETAADEIEDLRQRLHVLKAALSDKEDEVERLQDTLETAHENY